MRKDGGGGGKEGRREWGKEERKEVEEVEKGMLREEGRKEGGGVDRNHYL